MHSSINHANEYVSEWVVRVAERLTESTDGIVFPECDQPAVCGSDTKMKFTSGKISTPLRSISFYKSVRKTYAIGCGRGQIVCTRQICRTYRSRAQCHASGGN